MAVYVKAPAPPEDAAGVNSAPSEVAVNIQAGEEAAEYKKPLSQIQTNVALALSMGFPYI